MASVLAFAACCVVWLPLSLQQIVPAALSNTEYCHVSQEDLRVLPSTGFSRDPINYYTSTTTLPTGAPAPSVPSPNCLFQSYDPAFDTLIGNNRTIYQVGPSNPGFPIAVESPAYLAGATSCPAFADSTLRSLFQLCTPADTLSKPLMRADTDEVIFSSFAAATPSVVSRLSLETGEVTNLTITPSIGHSAGVTTYSNGQVCFVARLQTLSACM